VDPKLREAMGSQAVALAKAVGYDSAGNKPKTIDFSLPLYVM
jgi:acetyl/propionyl-CoA carboxylase alpha subunit